MALDIIWTDEANEGLDEIIDYLQEHWTEKTISRFFFRLEECMDTIKIAPNRQKDSVRKPGTKEYQHSAQTTIFYTFDEKNVYILKVWANLKDPKKL